MISKFAAINAIERDTIPSLPRVRCRGNVTPEPRAPGLIGRARGRLGMSSKKQKPEPALFDAPIREWRLLTDFPDYEISNDGHLRRATAGSNTKIGAHIRVGMSDGGYPKYGLTRPDGRRVHCGAHQLVASAFLPPAPEGKPNVLHDDDNRLNCLDSNLKWGSGGDNSADAKRNGLLALGENHPCRKKPWTRPRGEKHASAKLTENDVLSILKDQRTHKEVANFYGVNDALIARIRNGRVWKHLTNPDYRKMLEEGAADDR